jgi:hypothetical protein
MSVAPFMHCFLLLAIPTDSIDSGRGDHFNYDSYIPSTYDISMMNNIIYCVLRNCVEFRQDHLQEYSQLRRHLTILNNSIEDSRLICSNGVEMTVPCPPMRGPYHIFAVSFVYHGVVFSARTSTKDMPSSE